MRSFRNARHGYLLSMINVGLLLLLFVLALGSTKPDEFLQLAQIPDLDAGMGGAKNLPPHFWRGPEDNEALLRYLQDTLPSNPTIWLAADAPLDQFMNFTQALPDLGIERLKIAVLEAEHDGQ